MSLWDKLRQWHWNIYFIIYKIDSQWEFAVWHKELNLVLCDNLEGWDGVGGGGEVQEGGDMCMADSCWCMAEMNTTLQSNYPPIKKK